MRNVSSAGDPAAPRHGPRPWRGRGHPGRYLLKLRATCLGVRITMRRNSGLAARRSTCGFRATPSGCNMTVRDSATGLGTYWVLIVPEGLLKIAHRFNGGRMRRIFSRTFSPGGMAERLVRAGCSVVPPGLNCGGANHVLPGQKSWAILRNPSGTNVGKKLAADSRTVI